MLFNNDPISGRVGPRNVLTNANDTYATDKSVEVGAFGKNFADNFIQARQFEPFRFNSATLDYTRSEAPSLFDAVGAGQRFVERFGDGATTLDQQDVGELLGNNPALGGRLFDVLDTDNQNGVDRKELAQWLLLKDNIQNELAVALKAKQDAGTLTMQEAQFMQDFSVWLNPQPSQADGKITWQDRTLMMNAALQIPGLTESVLKNIGTTLNVNQVEQNYVNEEQARVQPQPLPGPQPMPINPTVLPPGMNALVQLLRTLNPSNNPSINNQSLMAGLMLGIILSLVLVQPQMTQQNR